MSIDAEEVRRLALGGENSRVEFKRNLPAADKVARTLAGFANTRGGLLLVGVEDDRTVRGTADARAAAAELARVAGDCVEPPLAPTVTVVDVDGRSVVVCSVGLSDARPHTAVLDSGERVIPLRLAASTREASGPAVEAMRDGARGRSSLTALERDVLAWVEREATRRGAEPATPDGFAKAHNVGGQRAKRAFIGLERRGHLVGHGSGRSRAYALP